MTENNHPFSWQALGRIIVAGALTVLIWHSAGVFVDILITMILATAIYPLVRGINRHLPLGASAVIVLGLLLVPFILFGIFVLPNLVRELPDMLKNFYVILQRIDFFPQSLKNLNLFEYVSQNSVYLLDSTKIVFNSIVSVMTIFFLMFYFVVDYKRLVALFLELFPDQEKKKIQGMLTEIAQVNGQYIRGNIIISIIFIVITFAGLVALNIPYALPLAIFAGILDLLPLVGASIGALPAIIFGFAISPTKGVLVIILNVLYQQLENGIISPFIYNKALHISPALSFLAVVIGGGLFGILGAFLALPIAASIPAMIKYVHGYSERNIQD